MVQQGEETRTNMEISLDIPNVPKRSISCFDLNTEELSDSNAATNISRRSVSSCPPEHSRPPVCHGVDGTRSSSAIYEKFLKITDGVLILCAAIFIISSIAYLCIWGYGFYFSGWSFSR